MDIQVASNFERLIFDASLYDADQTLKLMNNLDNHGKFILEKNILTKINESFVSGSLTEEETKAVIKKTYKSYKVLIDPHTAVAVGVANKFNFKRDTVVLATAHPAKFSDVVLNATNKKPELPENLKDILVKKEKFDKLPNELKKIKNYIFDKVHK
jgi:threonine synthase